MLGYMSEQARLRNETHHMETAGGVRTTAREPTTAIHVQIRKAVT